MFKCLPNLYVLCNIMICCISKNFDRKYFIDNKVQGKIFSWIHDFPEIFLP